MQTVILYIEGERVELFKDESISLTQTIQNVKDIGSIFTDFSKSFSVPASSTNNKIFKHYYNFNIQNGFNANDKKSAEIYLNSVLFRKGYIALNGVSMKENRPDNYKITFFGETVDLKKKLKEITLQNVFEANSSYNHEYNISNVKLGLESNLFSGNIIYPLISHTERFYFDTATEGADARNLHYKSPGTGTKNHGVKYTDLKPAIKLSAILERITGYTESVYGVGNGLNFELTGDSFFNTDNTSSYYNETYDNMYLWMSRAKGNIGKSYAGNQINTMVITDMTNPNSGWNPFCYRYDSSYPACEHSEITNGVWRIKPFSFNPAIGQVTVDFAVEWKVIGIGGGNFSLAIEDITGQTVVVSSATSLSADGITEHTITTPYLGAAGSFSNFRFVLTSTSGNFSYTTNLILEKRYGVNILSGFNYSYEYCNITNVLPTGILDEIIIADQMPKMLILEYLTSLFKMFNLTAFIQSDGKIKVQTLDSFYLTGNVIDITSQVDVANSSVDFSPPYEEIAFRNVAPKTLFATNFAEINNTVYGNLENSTSLSGIDTTDRGSKYVVKTNFDKIVYERLTDVDLGSLTNIQWGWSVDKDERPILTAPLVFINVNQSTGSDLISFIDGASVTAAASLSTYNRPSNSLEGSSAELGRTINFGAEIDEFAGIVKQESLFNKYYFNYISGVFNSGRRLTKVNAFLSTSFLQTYSLADTLVINQRSYNINSITTNLQTGKSELQLLNKIVI